MGSCDFLLPNVPRSPVKKKLKNCFASRASMKPEIEKRRQLRIVSKGESDRASDAQAGGDANASQDEGEANVRGGEGNEGQ